MSCRRICRELLWLARFGEFGPSSQPHLDHLVACRGCRDEVGFDRAMVQQLRIALAARIDDTSPPSSAWEAILERAQRPEPAPAARLWEWSAAVVGRLRFATAMASTGLALVLALNMEIVPIGPVTNDAAPASEATSLQQVPRMPIQRSSLEQLTREWGADGAESARRPDPEAAMTSVARLQPTRSAESAPAEPAADAGQELRLVFRPMQTPDLGSGEAAAPIDMDGSVQVPVRNEAGEPS